MGDEVAGDCDGEGARRDVIEIIEFAREVHAHVIGPNSLGLICPHTVKVGMAGGPAVDVKKATLPDRWELSLGAGDDDGDRQPPDEPGDRPEHLHQHRR